MKKLIEYFIKYPVAGNILILLIFSLGTLGFFSLNSTLMPQVDPGIIQITASYPGASPEEIEQGIILKIEDNLKGITGIKKLNAIAQENLGTVNVTLETSANTDLVLQDVKNAVDAINSFPAGMEPTRIKKIEFKSTAVKFVITGETDLRELKKYARKAEDELRDIKGISKVELSGFPDEEIEISFRENDLQTYNLTFTEATNAVKAANIDLTGGSIKGKDEELYIRTKQKKYYAKDLEQIVLKSTDKGIIRLADIAEVKDIWSENPNRIYVNGKPAVLITVHYTENEDIIEISKLLNNYTEVFNTKYKSVEATIITDFSKNIESMQGILLENGIMGILLVLFFLSLFLNRHLSFWVAFSIPLSFFGMFVLASMFGITLNRLSLFGMILVIGILVDDGIVIAENIYQHFERGKSPLRAAIDGTVEVIPAVFSAVVTTIIAFSSFFFIEGMMGQMFEEMAFVVVAVLLISLIEGAFILPAHIAHSKGLKREKKTSKIEKWFNNSIAVLRDKFYVPVLRAALNNKGVTISIVFGLLLITLGGISGGIIKMGDASYENTNYSTVEIKMPAGTPKELTIDVLNRIEQAAIKTGDEFSEKEGKNVITYIEKQITSTNTGRVSANYVNGDERNFLSTEFSNKLREKLGAVPEAERINFVEKSNFGKAVFISLVSPDIDQIIAANKELKKELNSLEGLKNVQDNNEEGMREIKVTLKDKAYLLGLDLNTVMSQVRQGFFGSEVQRINRGMDEVKIWVRYQKQDRAAIGKLEDMRIRTNKGNTYLLKDIANLEYDRNVTTIKHLNGKREITIEADVKDKTVNLSQIKEEVNKRILPALKEKYPEISTSMGGKDEMLKDTTESAMEVAPVILILLIAVIAFTFRSFLQTFLILALLPFGFIGIGWGHAIHNVAIDIPSMFGIIALLGVMVNDSLVLINTLNNNLRNGQPLKEAVFNAGVSRFRPILLTSLTTIAGLSPLIVSNDPTAQVIIPMAVSVAYGLLIATFLTLLVLPVLLIVTNNLKRWWKELLTGKSYTAEEVERAVVELKESQV